MRDPKSSAVFDLSVVVIGRNEGDRLITCLRSVQAMRGDFERAEIIYVDSASADRSPERARELGAKVIVLEAGDLSAAKARNAGWRAASSEFILFLDGDTILDPDFVEKARGFLSDVKIAAVWGHRRELYPERSIYNRVCDLDWIYPVGESEFFGGDALVRRKVLEEGGGYNETLKAGEEPEMCGRIRRLGYRLLCVDLPMTKHDLNMMTWRQYWRRAVRSGQAYAEVTDRFPQNAPLSWFKKTKQIFSHMILGILVLLGVVIMAGFFHSAWPILLSMVLGISVILRTALKFGGKTDDFKTAVAYGVHSHLAKLPLFLGEVCYWFFEKRKTRSEGNCFLRSVEIK